MDPSHSMPKPSEHALDSFDHDAQEREAETARKQADEAKLFCFLPQRVEAVVAGIELLHGRVELEALQPEVPATLARRYDSRE